MTIQSTIKLIDSESDAWARVEQTRKIPRGLELCFSVYRGKHGARINSWSVRCLGIREATIKVVAIVAIGRGADAFAYDADKELVFSSNGQDGTFTVIQQDSADKYSVLETVPTEKSARTMALDNKTHDIYLSAAQFAPPPAATADNPRPRPKIVPGSFHVLMFQLAK